jgi:hypothetical protein
MNLKFKVASAMFIALILTGCAAPQISMTKQVQAKIDQVDGVLTMPQSNLVVTVPATNPGNTGLLGALIVAGVDSARQSSAEKAAAPILNTLQGYDFNAVMLAATTETLGKTNNLKFAMPLRVSTVDSDSAKRIAFDQSKSSSILFCRVNYRLESGNLIVVAHAEMYPKADALKQFRSKPQDSNPLDEGNAIYRKTFTFTKQAITPTNIKNSLAEAAKSLSEQLAADLNHSI